MVIVKIKRGELKGAQKNNYQCFLGIPFAKPPIGDLRFCEPQPADPWDGIKDTIEFGKIPIQGYQENPPIGQEESEDCLFLNIWTPSADNKSRPVMVWIYGGGFLIGASSRPRLNGANLAIHGDVVVVSFNYRLGALGFLNLPGIPPNIGILDQIAALKWCRENINHFGGDPNNITIFGESAGGSSVSILLAIPAARGLFQKAIIESGAANPRNYGAERPKEGAEEFMSKLRIEKDNIDALFEVPLKKLIRAQTKIAGGILNLTNNPFQPFIDGKIIPEHPLETMHKGEASNVPIIIGSNNDELGFISILLKQESDKNIKPVMDYLQKEIQALGKQKNKLDNLIEVYRKEIGKLYPNNPFKYFDALVSDSMFGIPIIRTLEAYVKSQPNSYCYIFDYGSRENNIAVHTIEIPFVFGNLDTQDVADGGVKINKETEGLAKKVMDTWVTFARTGDPNHDGLPDWPAYDLRQRATMILGTNSKVDYDPRSILRKAWNGIL